MLSPRLLVTIGVSTVLSLLVAGTGASARTADQPIGACRLAGPPNEQVSLGFDRPPIRVPSTGKVRAKVVLVDFSDAPATAALRAHAVATVAAAGRFVASASYGRLSVVSDVGRGWVRMPHTAAEYSANDDGTYASHTDYIGDAVAASGASLTEADVLIVIASSNVGGMAGGAADVPLDDGDVPDGRLIDNALTVGTIRDGSDTGVLAHEFLHTLGLPDLYSHDAHPGEDYPFTGPFSLMANVSAASPSPTAWERWVLGWIDDSQVRCLGPDVSTVALTPIERVGGMKAAVVAIADESAVVVEYRESIGADRAGPGGVIVYLVDPSKEPGHGPLRLGRAHGSVMTPLQTGESITMRGVRVTALTSGQVRVQVPSG